MTATRLLDFQVLNLTASADSVFFSPAPADKSNQLWRSDGSQSGTTLVQDLAAGTPELAASSPSYITKVGGRLMFAADTGTIGRELWSSDGTSTGTALVKDVYLGASSGLPATSSAQYLYAAVVGGVFYFAGTTAETGTELWKSDGTAAGTVLVRDIATGSTNGVANSSFPSELTSFGRTLLFVADDGTTGYELWKSDGTTAGTTLIKDISSNAYYESYPSYLTVVANQVFFAATDPKNGRELWKTDGTTKGTVLVANLNTASAYGYGYGCYPYELTAVGSTLFFLATSSSAAAAPVELWASNGTSAGTVKVTGAFANVADLTAVGTTLFFTATASNGTNRELWKSVGTTAQQVKDINPGTADSAPAQLTAVNNLLYFSADDGSNGRELWRSDGTATGTVLVDDINPGLASSNPASLTPSGSSLFFNATGSNGDGLYSEPLAPYAPPTILKAVVSGSTVILTLSQPIKAAAGTPGGTLNPTYFYALVGGVQVKATAAAINGSTITLTLASAPAPTLITDVFYCPPAGASGGTVVGLADGTPMAPQTINGEVTADGFRSTVSVSGLALPYTTLVLLGTAAINGTANDAANTITGNSAANVLHGLGGADSLDGAGGSDVYLIAALSDYALGESIADSGSSGVDEIRFASTTANQNLVLQSAVRGIELVTIGTGSGASATITATTALSLNASAFNDNGKGLTLTGNNGVNTIIGTDYTDTIISNKGNDWLTGRAGADSFVFNQAPGSSNTDTITDFASGTDKLTFSKAVYTTLGTGSTITANQLLVYNGNPSLITASTRFLFNTQTSILAYDADGSGTKSTALDVAVLQGVITLASTDFMLVA